MRIGRGERFSELLTPTGHPVQLIRRPTDLIRSVAAAILLLLTCVAATQGEPDLASWQSFISGLPAWWVQSCAVVVIVALAVAGMLTLLSIARLRSDPTFARDVIVALPITLAASYLVSLLVLDTATAVGSIDPSRTTLLDFPDLILAVIVCVAAVACPHVARPNQRLLWVMMLASTACATATDPLAVLPAIAGCAVGLLVGSGWLSAVGSPAGLPDIPALRASLLSHGVQVSTITMEPMRPWDGAVACLADRVGTGPPLRIKVYGRDAVAADFWVRAYRRITYLDPQRSWSSKTVDMVEHEAALTAIAEQFDVPVTPVVAVSDWRETDSFIAVEWGGMGLHELPTAEITDELAARLWTTVRDLHAVGIVHARLGAASLRVVDGSVRLANLEHARFSSDKRLRDRDLASLLVVTAPLMGPARAVSSANTAIGTDQLNDLVAYLEPAAIRVPIGDEHGGLKRVLGELKTQIAAQTGMSPPPLAVLKRLTVRRVMTMLLLVLALVALVKALSGIDFATVADEVADATWILVFAALVVGQLVLVPEAMATVCLVPERLPFGPLVALQSAMRFLGLAMPGPAARVAANAEFLRKQGIVVARSLTLGALDSGAGLLVEVLILVTAAIVGDLSLALFGIEPLDINWALVTVGLLLLATVMVLVIRFVAPARKRAVVAWNGIRDVLDVLKGSPTRAVGLLFANLGARLISAFSLWLVLNSLGVSLDILAVLVVIAASNLLSGLIPVPGNVGVAEAALTTFLVAAGVPEDAAFAAAVVYRICTAYLPPLWGAGAQRWLQQNDYL